MIPPLDDSSCAAQIPVMWSLGFVWNRSDALRGDHNVIQQLVKPSDFVQLVYWFLEIVKTCKVLIDLRDDSLSLYHSHGRVLVTAAGTGVWLGQWRA